MLVAHTPTDRELIEQYAQAGDAMAFTLLLVRHEPRVRSVCRKAGLQAQDADAVTRATFLKLKQRAGVQAWDSSVGSWLRAVARHEIRARSHVSRVRR